MKFIKNIARWLNLALILLTLLAYLSALVNPAKVWLLAYPSLAYPFLLLANIAFIAFWAIRKNRYWLFSFGCILVGFTHLSNFFSFHFFKDKKGEGEEIRVMTYNIGGMSSYPGIRELTRKEKSVLLKALVQKAGNPQILCIQEGGHPQVMDSVKTAFAHSHYFKENGTLIYSNFPFVDKGFVPFPKGTGNSCVWANLKTPSGVVRVYSAHLESNKMSQTADRIATSGDLRRRSTWKDIVFVMRRYKNGAVTRAGQAQLIAQHIAASPYPVILCGDFNDPPVSYIYRLLSKGLQDSFVEKGMGIGSTYAGKLPALRIDYILSAPQFRVLDHQVLKSELSDHYPVLAKMTLK